MLGPSAERLEEAQEGDAILLAQIQERGAYDPYPYAAYLHFKLNYLLVVKPPDFQVEMGELYRLAQKALEAHSQDKRIREAADHVMNAYLRIAVKPS